jgi:bifunctional DNA-binding transcriptional regulator/antitoxin component of YhaV-PrlF toxin-antitoxin module
VLNPSVLTICKKTIREEKEVAQKKLVEHNALLQAVEMGMSKDAIMEKFNIKNLQGLKLAYYDALVALDKIKDVKKGQKPKKVDNKVSINSRGSLVIPKKLIDDLDLGEMDTFKVVKSDSGLMLKTVKKPTKTILRKRNGHSLSKNYSEASELPN